MEALEIVLVDWIDRQPKRYFVNPDACIKACIPNCRYVWLRSTDQLLDPAQTWRDNQVCWLDEIWLIAGKEPYAN